MSIVYRLKASEIDDRFLESLKSQFGNKEIEIVVSEFDETEYLLKSPSNQKRLLRAIENLNERQNLVEVDLSNLQWGGDRRDACPTGSYFALSNFESSANLLGPKAIARQYRVTKLKWAGDRNLI